MSTVVVQVGQCGNQVGENLWSVVERGLAPQDRCTYYARDGCLRSINIDSEPKVVKKLASNKSQCYRNGNILHGKRGRGSNWAMGYHGNGKNDNCLLADGMDAIRKEIERCETFSGIILIHSLAGGTGSGLGSKLLECLRDQLGIAQLMSCVVAPHKGGESPLQNYNSLLCLAHLQRFCDGALIFHNDEIIQRLQHKARGLEKDCGFSLEGINEHIASCVAGLILPTNTLSRESCSIGREPWEMLSNVCAMPQYKFLHVNHVEKRKASWETMAGNLSHSLKKYDCDEKPFSSIANLVVARGDVAGEFSNCMNNVDAKIKSIYRCVMWNPFPVDFWIAKKSLIWKEQRKSLTIASNYTNIKDYLQHIISHSEEKYKNRAYLHWYWKYGCEQNDFDECFEILNEVVCAYTEVSDVRNP